MNYARHPARSNPETIPRLPPWITSGRAQTPEDVSFLSGAALSYLHVVLGHESVPKPLLRNRLALRAAEVCVAFSGRSERSGELRDEIALLRPGDQPGPAGQVCQMWMRAVERPVSIRSQHRAMPQHDPERIAVWLDQPHSGQGGPVDRAALVLGAVLADAPQHGAAALVLADAALAQALGWDHVIPLLAVGMMRRDLRKTDDDLRLACHEAIVTSVTEAARMAADLAQRAARLSAIAPKLRARGSDEAVQMFLNRDAVAPSALSSLNSDRSARRFCDRLVELGVARELTGRDTFRLYGV
ncbi:Protein of unknown function [Pseudosulfitobacter pseudonitzschiae]|jgi:hypothetical protein|uniref:DUF1403 family protein n=2 Tax=Roseobacteraceae TaxID=2854170 RepID=A0A845M734_9RHOB|nr:MULTISPECIES: DUF1403 family protein [Roseobacteraceae]KEJ93645.1 hypothetical protein SUH3_16565 [Pseudosulfitobacter pseudonitzschiae]MDF3384630.1 DUF1403 family protein [Sulfitobacter sp. Ks11]MDF3387975.1 DUF1403 family protein [Sulfitobacter sp. M85]MDF3391395.1 DUF1403 family protein [Sulfitobacter sp. Ks16]MDF3402106.1 DUF1403 family protein [Sulfitobacter sp. KE39]